MCGINKSAFTLIEILIALVIVAILATMVAPNLRPRSAAAERGQFISKLNHLVGFGWQHALATGRVHRVLFDFAKNTIKLEQSGEITSATEELKFGPLTDAYTATSLEWPEYLQIKQFFIEGFDEMQRFSGNRQTGTSWFFIVPDGLTQSVTINSVDIRSEKRSVQVGLVLNPFSAQFTAYDTFQK